MFEFFTLKANLSLDALTVLPNTHTIAWWEVSKCNSKHTLNQRKGNLIIECKERFIKKLKREDIKNDLD